MSLELWNTLATVGTFVVILVTAIAATVQLRHMRRNNELQAVLALRSEITPGVSEAFEFVSTELTAKLKDPQFRVELQDDFAPSRRAHKELILADYYEHIGTYVRRKLIGEAVYFATFQAPDDIGRSSSPQSRFIGNAVRWPLKVLNISLFANAPGTKPIHKVHFRRARPACP